MISYTLFRGWADHQVRVKIVTLQGGVHSVVTRSECPRRVQQNASPCLHQRQGSAGGQPQRQASAMFSWFTAFIRHLGRGAGAGDDYGI